MSTSHSKQTLLKRTAKLEKELAAKSYGLKIESALEKVSIAAMSMKKPKDLSGIGSLIFKELKKLGFTDLRNSEIIINNDAKETITSYYYSDYGVTGVIELDYKSNAIVKGWADQLKKASNAFAEVVIPEKEMKAWRKYREEIGYLPDSKLNKAKTVYYYSYSTGAGALSISSFKPVSKDQIKILKRFRNVFQLSYRRYIDIAKAEAQAKEAEIELALEKVRAKTMAMQKSEELQETTLVLFQQFKSLGVTAAQVSICVFDEDTRMGEMFVTLKGEKIERSFPMELDKEVFVMKKAKKAFLDKQKKFSFIVKGKELQDYNHWRNSLIGRKGWDESNAVRKQSWYVNGVFFSRGLMGFSSDVPSTDETLKLLDRFAAVFDLTFTRFLDLQKAETQARESQIQLALERVRARTMAMQRSDELAETATVLFEQFSALDEFPERIAIGIVNETEHVFEIWATQHGGSQMNLLLKLSLDEPHVMKKMYAAWKEGKKSITIDLQGNELDEYFQFLVNSGAQVKREIFGERRVENVATFSKGVLMIITSEPRHYEAIKILERFAKVFEQTYTRFLDLQKAEAQAREAKIEAALERVRSKAMAMHNSADMSSAASIVFAELRKLGINPIRSGVGLLSKEDHKAILYGATTSEKGDDLSLVGWVMLVSHPIFEAQYEKWLLHEDYFPVLENEEIKKYYEKLSVNFSVPVTHSNEKQYGHFLMFTHGFLFCWSQRPYEEAEIRILKRFASVIDLTFKRYFDLQKAEAQAREAKIEAALERVRSHAMAMQTSEGLNALIGTVFTELTKLDLVLTRCVILIYEGNEKGVRWWMANSEAPSMPMNFFVKYADMPFFNEYLKGWQERSLKWQYILEGENKFNTDEFLFKETELSQLPDFVIAGMRAPDRVYLNASFNNFGDLTLASLEPLSDEHFDILLRFAKVFDLTYTRFNDLKQAEAQAREAQIQLALERVRARTMAMQRSDELAEVATLLFKQVSDLGIKTWTTGFNIWSDDNNYYEDWITNPQGGFIEPYTVDATKFSVFIEIADAKKSGKEFFVQYVEGEMLEETYRHLSKFGEKQFAQLLESGFQFPSKQLDHFVFGSKISLMFITYEPVPEAHDIFKRFGKVFEQTYTRFVDLQKAEVQVRESQIQLALERVRARTMAMHKSVELAETAQVMFHQLQELGGIPDRIAIGVADEAEGVVNFWSTDQLGSHINNSFKARLDERTVISKTYQVWKDQKKSLVIDLHGEELKEWLRFAREEMGIAVKDEFIKDRRVHNLAFFSHGWLLVTTHEPQSAETIQILERFAAVFSLTYRRFLDLQRAEAQAREAQIEAALERVRARSMAMHHSSELHDAADVLFQQLRIFGGNIMNGGIALCKQDADEDEYWLSSNDGLRPVILIPHTEDSIQKKLYEDWKNKAEFYSIAKGGDELRAHYNYLRSVPHLKPFFEEGPDWSYPTWQKWHAAYFSHGYLFMITLEPYEEEKILIRFARVFEQAYTRFLDLQKAEAQAREAQIEAALERVRSKAMAMHISEDLGETIRSFYQQMRLLGLTPKRCGVGIIGGKERVSNLTSMYTTEEGESVAVEGKLLLKGHPMLEGVYQHFLEQKEYYPVLRGNEIRDYYQLISPQISYPDYPQGEVQFGYFFFFPEGGVYAWTEKQMGESELNIYRRFTSVLSLTYKRYLDLKKAEAQAREAQIEASLERVRSKTMAMHNSNDVGETVAAMFAEFVHLDIHTNRCGILIFNDQHVAEVWTARSTPGGNAKLIIGKLDLDAHQMLRSVYNAWKAKETFYQYVLLDNDLVQYYIAINNSKFYPTQFDLNALPSKEFHSDFLFADGAVFSFTNEPVAEEHAKIIKRFAGVFGQTYRRYLDLQKAEAQAREAQIEAGLERVRARTMAMHSSEDVSIATATMFTELEKLGVENFRGGITNILTNRTQDVWSVTNLAEEKVLKAVGAFDIDAHPFWQLMFKEWEAKNDFLHYFLGGQEKEEYLKILNATQGYFPQVIEKFPDVNFQVYYFNEGAIWTNSLQPHSEEDKQVMKRFTSVFSLTFRRYQDLKKAEAQAKEAQIETSLERVRSKTMAMHSSDDVTSAIATMFTELDRLGIENMRCGIAHYLEDHKMEVWSVSNLADGKVVRGAGLLDTNSIPFWKIFYSTWQKKEDFLYYLMAGKEKEDYFKKISTLQNYLSQSIEDVPDLSIQTYYFPEGSVWAFSLKPHSEEDKQVMKRFASVFSLTFRRYQDLKKAEAQTREATIEAALEKVRGKAMAMHNSNDLSVTASLVFTELRKLGINPIRCGVGLLNKESQKAQLYSATSSADGDSLSLVGWVILSEHPVLEKIYESWLDDEEYYPQLQGEQRRSYYQLLLKGLPVTAPQVEDDKKQYGHFLPFSVGCLYAWSEAPYNEAEIKILKRFATIIDLTFRRYIELQTSEANSREAVKQAALDRVRAEIASMRTVADLDRITPLIWNELTILGLPFIRCGIFLMDDSQQLIHTFLSTPDGKAIGAFHLPYDTPGNFSVMLKHWLDKETYISRWDEVDFIGIAEVLVQQGSITTREQYLSSLPKGGFYLHFLPFLQGMLYVGNTKQLGEEEIELTQHVADAFSTAYARYEDFNKLEAAKQQVEKTLTDLKQAQTQLVQSEKMASLGELTAGIAHEIQNPLNFVNNFSDVSNELLDEMKEELAKGNIDDAIAIAEDVKQNLEKINHHGKRADGIVKGMLQHSRTSSGQKEMTDINVLADEYLRLAYHGLRAKEKSFNAKFETDFDKNVGEINIIPQDIGRVILNLINNAFYAVSERKKAEGGGFEPTVAISTASIQSPLGGRSIQIKVADNGGGIPQKVIDKIFQPFFTTKPTGQGTGLGLSLAYDIIKAHGGDINVETKEGEGSEFVIQLPVV